MMDDGKVVDLRTGEEFTQEDNEKMHASVKAQIDNPGKINPKYHIKRSDIWNTQQTIRKIQRQLVDGYTFDKEHLTALVNTMFGFINGIVRPGAEVAAEEHVEEITE